MARCASCGYENPEGDDFCGRCGRYLGWESPGTVARTILVSCRREDAAGHARRLHGLLSERYGRHRVVVDIDTPADSIAAAVAAADALVVVIGDGWLDARDEHGRRRLDDPDDYVRHELAAALSLDVPVVPVLVQGAPMPAEQHLPEPLRPFARRAAFELTDPRWRLDSEQLLVGLDRIVEPVPEKATAPGVAAVEAQLTRMLREAALAGVVPAPAAGPRVAVPPPPAQAASPPAAPPPPAPVGRAPLPKDAAVRRPLADRLLRLAVPLALIGGAVAALKWLVGFGLEQDGVPPEEVECTVFAPPSAAPGSAILVQAFVHRPEQADDARAIALELDTDARRRTFRTLESPVGYGSRLDFELRLPGLDVDDPVTSLTWRGRTEAVQFGVRIPEDARLGTVIGTVEVSIDAAPVGQLKFKLTIDRVMTSARSEPHELARRYTAAFISYASKDRDEVLERVQMLSAVGIGYFQDVLSLEPGDRWSKKLELGIDECDLFLLFWSQEAKGSEWVRKEVQYALARRGGDELAPPEIRPVILEGPPIVEPWEELAELHFNDRLLYFMSPARSG